jgi:hypothetical protein
MISQVMQMLKGASSTDGNNGLRVSTTGSNHGTTRTFSILERSTRISDIPEDTECHVDNDGGKGVEGGWPVIRALSISS